MRWIFLPVTETAAENPISQNYVVTKGSKISIALSDKL